MRSLALLLLATLGLGAAETPVALWGAGPGTLDGRPGKADAEVDTGRPIVAGAGPVRLELLGFPGSDIILGPHAAVHFTIAMVSGKRQLVVELDRGAVQVDITGTGPWSGLMVRGGVVEARVTGTLFVVERSEQEGDFVALVRGKLNVRLRQEIAEGGGQATDLTSRQGVAGGPDGLGGVVMLNNRPQVTSGKSVARQSTGEASGDGGWDEDDAGTLTGDIPDGDLVTLLPGDLPGLMPGLDLDSEVIDAVLDDLPNAAVKQFSDPQGVAQDLIGTAGVGNGFAAPPPPPGP